MTTNLLNYININSISLLSLCTYKKINPSLPYQDKLQIDLFIINTIIHNK